MAKDCQSRVYKVLNKTVLHPEQKGIIELTTKKKGTKKQKSTKLRMQREGFKSLNVETDEREKNAIT